MDHQLLSYLLLIPVAIMGYSMGWQTKEFPSEEEMIRRIVDSRVRARIEKEVEAEVATEIAKRAAL